MPVETRWATLLEPPESNRLDSRRLIACSTETVAPRCSFPVHKGRQTVYSNNESLVLPPGLRLAQDSLSVPSTDVPGAFSGPRDTSFQTIIQSQSYG